jgi:hypothetical protein
MAGAACVWFALVVTATACAACEQDSGYDAMPDVEIIKI